jgi:vacuolar-type H+-ATPase subunit C/Vma6
LLKSLEIEAAINKNDAMKTWDRVNRLKGRDKRCIKIIGITYDITNIMIVLRLKKLGFKSDIIRRNLIPIYHELTEGELIKAIEAPTDRDAIKIFAAGYYVGVISPLMSTYEVKEELTIFETAFKRFHSNECEKTFVFQPFNLGEPLAYLYLKLYEIRDLVAILAGKYSKLSAERIAPILILHQPPHPI